MSVPVPAAPPAGDPEPTPSVPSRDEARAAVAAADHHDDGDDSSIGNRLSRIVTMAPPKPGTMTRLKYAMYLFVGLLFCMLLRGSFGHIVGFIPYYKDACEVHHLPPKYATGGTTPTAAPPSWRDHVTIPSGLVNKNIPGAAEIQKVKDALSGLCLEATVVYRVSFSLFLFFLLHLCSVSDITCCIQDSVRDEMQSGYFGCKTFLLVCINLVSYAIPTPFFAYYAWACMYASALFLVIQVLILVDFSYEWNETWGALSEGNEKWLYYLMFMTIGGIVGGIGMMGYGFANFTPHEDCNLHGFILLANIFVGILCFGVAVWVPHGSLLPTAITFAYTSFLVVSALRTSPDTRCGGIAGDGLSTAGASWYSILFTSLMTAGALAYTASSVGGSDDSLSLNDDENNRGYSGHLPAYIYFHGIMVLASMYLAMVASDWTISGADGAKQGGATVSFWVKVASSWMTYAMYLWSLLAPYFCCKDRDYGYGDVPSEWN